jgi:hypothetical protein
MPSLLRTNELCLVNDILFRMEGDEDEWTGQALLDVADPKHFSVTLRPAGEKNQKWSSLVSESGDDSLWFVLGAASPDTDLTIIDVDEKSETVGSFFRFFSNDDNGVDVYNGADVYDTNTLPGSSNVLDQNIALQMTYKDGQICFGFEGKEPSQMFACPEDVRPFISIKHLNTRLSVDVDTHRRMRKRAHDNDEGPATKVVKSLWQDRLFTDATIVCGARKIPVHRNVLVAASPFFSSAFQGEMKEGLTAEVVIADADPEAVEALLAYLYTGQVGDKVDAMALLPVAHRFGASALVDHCASQLVEELREENIAKAMAAMRPFLEDPVVRPHWNAMVSRVQANSTLAHAAMRGA